jgi:hypothetical protein
MVNPRFAHHSTLIELTTTPLCLSVWSLLLLLLLLLPIHLLVLLLQELPSAYLD